VEVDGKYKLLMIRTKYLKNTLTLSEDIFQKAYVEFMGELSSKLNSQRAKKENQDDDKRIEAEKEEKDENLKQVFKKIAREIHPDKLENIPEFEKKYKQVLFEKARTALEENDYYAIVEVAEELGIEPPPPTKKQIEMMKQTNGKLENEIKKIEDSLIWGWYHGEEDKRKELMERYIEYLEKQCAGS
jgi:hypothetical protein